MINIIQNNFGYEKYYQLNKVRKVEPVIMQLGHKNNRNEKKKDNLEGALSSDSLSFEETLKRAIEKTK